MQYALAFDTPQFSPDTIVPILTNRRKPRHFLHPSLNRHIDEHGRHTLACASRSGKHKTQFDIAADLLQDDRLKGNLHLVKRDTLAIDVRHERLHAPLFHVSR